MLDVEKIELKFRLRLFDTCAVLILNLGPSCDSWTNGVSQTIKRNLFFEHGHKLWAFGSWSDYAHFTAENVNNLGQFVDPKFTDPSAKMGNAVIAVASPSRSSFLRIVDMERNFSISKAW